MFRIKRDNSKEVDVQYKTYVEKLEEDIPTDPEFETYPNSHIVKHKNIELKFYYFFSSDYRHAIWINIDNSDIWISLHLTRVMERPRVHIFSKSNLKFKYIPQSIHNSYRMPILEGNSNMKFSGEAWVDEGYSEYGSMIELLKGRISDITTLPQFQAKNKPMDIKERINAFLSNPDKRLQSILNSDEFYFEKGRTELTKWHDLSLTDVETNDLDTFSGDYRAFENEASNNNRFSEIFNQICKIVSYCDLHAKNKKELNEYSDNRVLANAGVRQANWVEHIVQNKIDAEYNQTNSVTNALNYLNDPGNNATILSEEHRRMISEKLFNVAYDPKDFIANLKNYFDEFSIPVKNQENYTYALSTIIYHIIDVWHESIVSLMASDGTGWQDKHILQTKNNDASTVWNSKKPTGGKKTLEAMQKIIDDAGELKLFYTSNGKVRYVAYIEDFAINQKELDEKKWNKRYEQIFDYSDNFDDYADDRKHANIIFLVSNFEAIEPIDIENFSFYKCDPPRQDNMSPVETEPEELNFTTVQLQTDSSMKKDHEFPLNQILFGPPGTGKTYNTFKKAIHIINPEFNTNQDWETVKNEYDRLVAEEQIFFTTFHQSMSYEDFIEGIKPQEPKEEGGAIWYKVEEGIFKNIAKKAKENIELSALNKGEESSESLPFEKAFEMLKTKVNDELLHEPDLTPNERKEGLVLNLDSSFFSIYGIIGSSIKMMNRSGNKQNTMNKDTLRKIYDNPENLDKIIKGGMRGYYDSLVKEMRSWKEQLVEEISKSHVKPYVLIIDEINRGNIAAIFGELITLIEKSKRFGEAEELEAILPYSKEPFTVPNNLYIIGTMNTADRSVEALDAALRRRFSFEEMPPLYNLPELDYKLNDNIAIKASDILKTINTRIEKLLDKDHMIGHSYFIKNGEDDMLPKIQDAFYKSIIPLLQEYFFGDYGKIGLVLGKGFVVKNEWQNNTFADFDHESSSQFDEREVYSIVDYRNKEHNHQVNSISLNFEKALKLLMNQTIE